ncbi:class I SAM-dependent methyltransferase [archaeon]|jgi:SAM-dependent methyltransferase|nr:class I SAM-dependent methyltransferase [archaeon]
MVNKGNKTNICFWEDVLKDAPQSYKELFVAERKYLRRHVGRNSRLLEVGCGDGRSLRDVFTKTRDIYGVDNDTTAVLDARRNLVDVPEASILLEDGRDLPFRGNLFDYVICMTTPANFGEDKYKFYGEMRRTLKDDGEIIISVFNEGAFDDRMSTYVKSGAQIKDVRGTTVVFDESIGSNTSEQFSRSELKETFYDAKLKPREIVKVGVGYICRLGKD